MGEEISEELEELEAKARDEAIKQMLKAWEERPEEKRGSWGPLFGHDAISRNMGIRYFTVALARESTMDVTAHATGDNNYSELVQLYPGKSNKFSNGSYKIRNLKITGLGSGDKHAFGYIY